MTARLANVSLWVRDQEEAKQFYTQQLGWEVRSDFSLPELGGFRWLTVSPKQQPDVGVALIAIPGPPVMDERTTQQVRDLMRQGFAGTLFLETDDARASYEELKQRGVRVDEPKAVPYGIETAFNDPSGNTIRLNQPPRGA
jgi:predicted enzyme related to lactoylglutathione lyase